VGRNPPRIGRRPGAEVCTRGVGRHIVIGEGERSEKRNARKRILLSYREVGNLQTQTLHGKGGKNLLPGGGNSSLVRRRERGRFLSKSAGGQTGKTIFAQFGPEKDVRHRK